MDLFMDVRWGGRVFGFIERIEKKNIKTQSLINLILKDIIVKKKTIVKRKKKELIQLELTF